MPANPQSKLLERPVSGADYRSVSKRKESYEPLQVAVIVELACSEEIVSAVVRSFLVTPRMHFDFSLALP